MLSKQTVEEAHEAAQKEEQSRQVLEDIKTQSSWQVFTCEDTTCIKVFQGCALDNMQTLKYNKIIDRIVKDHTEKLEFVGFEELENKEHVFRIIRFAADSVKNKGLFMLLKCEQEQPEQLMKKLSDCDSVWGYNFEKTKSNDQGVLLACYYQGRVEFVADQEAISNYYNTPELNMTLDDRCQIYCFEGADPEVMAEDIDREIEMRQPVTQVMLSNNRESKSKIITLKDEQNQDGILYRRYVFTDFNIKHPQYGEDYPPEEEDLVGVLVCKDEQYRDNRYALLRVSKNGIAIYDKDGDYEISFYNFTIRRINFIDDQYLYFVMDMPVEAIKKSTVLKINEEISEKVEVLDRRAGVGMLDVFQLVNQAKLEYYMFVESKCAPGFSSVLSVGQFVNRLCFSQDFSTLSLIPYFHRNTFNFMGMGKKTDYLIWRQSLIYFTALNRHGYLQTWSLCTGKLLFNEKLNSQAELKDYLVYAADHDYRKDASWCQDFQQQETRSISLVKNTWPMEQKAINDLILSASDEPEEYQSEEVSVQCDDCITDPFRKIKKLFKNCVGSNELKEQKVYESTDEERLVQLENQIHLPDPSQQDYKFEYVPEISDFQGFEFKVLELSVWNEQEGYQPPERAEILQTYEQKSSDFQILFSFKFLLRKEQNQQLFLSDDCTKLLEIDRKTTAKIYKMHPDSERLLRERQKWRPQPDKQDLHETKNIGMVKWDLMTVIHEFPAILQGSCSANFLFSKDFEYMLDIDYKRQKFIISRLRKNVISCKPMPNDIPEVITMGSHSHFDFELDKNLLGMSFAYNQSHTEALAEAAKRFHWINNTHFEVVNTGGVSLRVQIVDKTAKKDLQRRAALRNIECDRSIESHLDQARLEQFGYFQLRKKLDSRVAAQNPEERDADLILFGKANNKKDDKLLTSLLKFQEYAEKEFDRLVDQEYLQYDLELRKQKRLDKQAFTETMADFFEVKSFCKIDNFTQDSFERFHHYTLETKPFEPKNVVNRLMSQMQDVLCDQAHNKNKTKWQDEEIQQDVQLNLMEKARRADEKKNAEKQNQLNFEEELDKKIESEWDSPNVRVKFRNDQKAKNKMTFEKYREMRKAEMKRPEYIRESIDKLYSVCYTPPLNEKTPDNFQVSFAFTLVDWYLSEKLIGALVQLKEIERGQQIQMCFNLFPGGNTLLHQLVAVMKNQKKSHISESLNYIIQGLFQAANGGFESDTLEFQKEMPIEIPMCTNPFGNTAVHLALSLDSSQIDPNTMPFRNLSLAAIILSNIKDYTPFHSGPVLGDVINEAVRLDVPGIADFLSSRLKKVEYISSIQNQFLDKKKLQDGFKYTQAFVDAHINEQELQTKIFADDPKNQNEQAKRQKIEQFIFDIPHIQKWNRTGRKFLHALGDLQSNYSEPHALFSERIIQIIIETQWLNARKYFYFKIILPYVALLAFFFVWSDWALDAYTDQREQIDLQRCSLSDYINVRILQDVMIAEVPTATDAVSTENTSLLTESSFDTSPTNSTAVTQDNSKTDLIQETPDDFIGKDSQACNKSLSEFVFQSATSIIVRVTAITWTTLALAVYFLLLELIQAAQNWQIYWTRWQDQALDLLAPILITINCVRLLRHINDSSPLGQYQITLLEQTYTYQTSPVLDKPFWTIQALAQLAIFSKGIQLVYIQPRLAYLMQMIGASMKQITPFLGFLAATIFAVGSMFFMISKIYFGMDTVYAIRQLVADPNSGLTQDVIEGLPTIMKDTNQTDGARTYGNIADGVRFSFNFALGNVLDAASDMPGYDWVGQIAIIFTWIFIQILLLNLLIAIISSVYDKKTEQAEQEYYRSKMQLLLDLALLENDNQEEKENEEDRSFKENLQSQNQTPFLFVTSPLQATNQLTGEDETEMQKLVRQTEQIKQELNDISYQFHQAKEDAQRERAERELERQRELEAYRKRGNMTLLESIDDKLNKLLGERKEFELKRKEPYWQKIINPDQIKTEVEQHTSLLQINTKTNKKKSVWIDE